MDDDRLRRELDLAADGIDAGDTIGALGGVRATTRRRRFRRTGIGALGAATLLVGGVAVVVTQDDQRGDESIRSASPTTPEPDPVTTDPVDLADPDSGSDGAEPGVEPGVAPTESATVAVDPTAVPGIGEGDGIEYVEWLVPWDDGFLAMSTVHRPQPLPPELPQEVVDLFPPEVVELFADGLPPTIEEATRMLSEAGLLDEVTTVLSEHPEVNDLIYSETALPPEPVVRFSRDGEEWSPVEMTLPDGATGFRDVTVAGGRLYTVDVVRDLESHVVLVSSTSDLTTWETHAIDVSPPADLPPGVSFDVWPTEIVANDRGWVVAAQVSHHVFVEQFLPDEVNDLIGAASGGYGYSTGPDGVEVTVDPVDGGASATFTYTWDELGVDADVVGYIERPSDGLRVWASPHGGTPVEGGGVEDRWLGGDIVALPDRFVQIGPDLRTSTDGLTWTDVDMPLDAVMTGLAAGDGLIVVGDASGDGSAVYEVDGSLTEWTPTDIPGAPDPLGSVFASGSGSAALVMDSNVHPFQDVTIVVEHEGHRLTQTVGAGSLSYELVEIESGDVLLTELVDLRSVQDPSRGPFEHATGGFGADGITFFDPETGDELVSIPQRLIDQAFDEQFAAREPIDQVYEPDLWLLVPLGDGRWLVDDLDDTESGDGSYSGIPRVAVNGDTVLVSAPTGWLRYDVGS